MRRIVLSFCLVLGSSLAVLGGCKATGNHNATAKDFIPTPGGTDFCGTPANGQGSVSVCLMGSSTIRLITDQGTADYPLVSAMSTIPAYSGYTEMDFGGTDVPTLGSANLVLLVKYVPKLVPQAQLLYVGSVDASGTKALYTWPGTEANPSFYLQQTTAPGGPSSLGSGSGPGKTAPPKLGWVAGGSGPLTCSVTGAPRPGVIPCPMAPQAQTDFANACSAAGFAAVTWPYVCPGVSQCGFICEGNPAAAGSTGVASKSPPPMVGFAIDGTQVTCTANSHGLLPCSSYAPEQTAFAAACQSAGAFLISNAYTCPGVAACEVACTQNVGQQQ